MEEVTKYESKPLTAKDIKSQVDLIQDVMKIVMKDHEHYGVIPGCGDKPALLKPGAEKLNLTFRMAPDPETEIIDMGNGHREYRVKCILRSIETGHLLGAGVGSASTMETKWRYRNAEPEITAKFVPGEYWNIRKNDPAKALEMIGGKGFATKKVEGNWYIAKLTGEKVEYDNPADYYNTCWKMAKKRSLVDAVLTVTAASDIFTQDIDEMVENGVIPGKKESSSQTDKKKNPPKDQTEKENKTITCPKNQMDIDESECANCDQITSCTAMGKAEELPKEAGQRSPETKANGNFTICRKVGKEPEYKVYTKYCQTTCKERKTCTVAQGLK